MGWIGHHKGATYWDDLRTPASSINPAGAAAPPSQDTETLPGTLLFSASSTNVVAMVLQMPHHYKEGTELHPHVHWMKTTSASGNVVWQLRYKVSKIGEVTDAAFTTLTASTPIAATADQNTAGQHMITAFAPMVIEGLQISDMIICELSRLGPNGSDTYGADARLLEFDIHYEQDAPGSRIEYRKEPV